MLDGDIEEVENPDNPSGQSLFRFTVYKATESTLHKKKVVTDKTKNDGQDFDFSFDDVDIGWNFKGSNKALQAIASQASGPGQCPPTLQPGQASGSGSNIPQPQPQKPPLALEDAKDKDKLMCKVEEAVKGCYALLLKASKVSAHLPATSMGNKHKASLTEFVDLIKEQETILKNITITGCMPMSNVPMDVRGLKTVLKDFQNCFNDLKQALDMATPLLKPKGNVE